MQKQKQQQFLSGGLCSEPTSPSWSPGLRALERYKVRLPHDSLEHIRFWQEGQITPSEPVSKLTFAERSRNQDGERAG